MAYSFKVTVITPITGKGAIVPKGTSFQCVEQSTTAPTNKTLSEALKRATGIDVPTSNIYSSSLKIEKL
jgi:hypothetical protein